MTVADILSDLSVLGVTIEARGETLVTTPAEDVPPEITSEILAHRVELLQLLRTAASPRPQRRRKKPTPKPIADGRPTPGPVGVEEEAVEEPYPVSVTDAIECRECGQLAPLVADQDVGGKLYQCDGCGAYLRVQVGRGRAVPQMPGWEQTPWGLVQNRDALQQAMVRSVGQPAPGHLSDPASRGWGPSGLGREA